MLQIASIILISILTFQIIKKSKLSKIYDGELLETQLEDKSIVDETKFWEIISNTSNTDYNTQIATLHTELSKLNNSELKLFQNTFDLLMTLSYKSELWNKAYAINLGCSDDCFEYFRTWLIAQGKDKFYSTLNNPNHLIYFGKKELVQNYEGIGYVAHEVAEKRRLTLKRHPTLPTYELHNPEIISNIGLSGILMTITTWFN